MPHASCSNRGSYSPLRDAGEDTCIDVTLTVWCEPGSAAVRVHSNNERAAADVPRMCGKAWRPRCYLALPAWRTWRLYRVHVSSISAGCTSCELISRREAC